MKTPPLKRRMRFSVSHEKDAEFRGDGLRAFFRYRDLGIKGATGGRVGAQVIRAARVVAKGTGRHKHRLDFQLVYVLRGRVTFWYEGVGEVELRAGSCVHQPPGIVHELIRGSADLELLEIILPAEFGTIEVRPTTIRTKRPARQRGTARGAGTAPRRAARSPRPKTGIAAR